MGIPRIPQNFSKDMVIDLSQILNATDGLNAELVNLKLQTKIFVRIAY
jgi:hypothetical protein